MSEFDVLASIKSGLPSYLFINTIIDNLHEKNREMSMHKSPIYHIIQFSGALDPI